MMGWLSGYASLRCTKCNNHRSRTIVLPIVWRIVVRGCGLLKVLVNEELSRPNLFLCLRRGLISWIRDMLIAANRRWRDYTKPCVNVCYAAVR